jgi:hypothetical protein
MTTTRSKLEPGRSVKRPSSGLPLGGRPVMNRFFVPLARTSFEPRLESLMLSDCPLGSERKLPRKWE